MLVLAALALPPLFYILCKAASLVVSHIQAIAERSKIPLTLLGAFLGLLTSLPEFIIGMNAIANDIPDLSLGNLMGGLPVLFGGVMGFTIALNGKIRTNGKTKELLPYMAYLLLPLLAGLDGHIGWFDAIVLIGLYVLLLLRLKPEFKNPEHPIKTSHASLWKTSSLTLVGVLVVAVSANLIVRLTLFLLAHSTLDVFGIGTVVFALGTNLPEVSVAFAAWQRGSVALTWSNIVGSAMANILFIGLFALIKPFPVAFGMTHVFFAVWLVGLFGLFALFYHSERVLRRNEGVAILAIFVTGLIIQTLLILR